MPGFVLRGQSEEAGLQYTHNFDIQNHIHMFTALDAGPENGPVMKWAATTRAVLPVSLASPQRAIRGILHVHTPKRSGLVFHPVDYRYQIKVRARDGNTLEDRIEALRSMHGSVVFFCDHYHPPNTEDHTDAVKQMFLLVQFESVTNDSPSMQDIRANIQLRDIS